MFGPVNEFATPRLADITWEVGWHEKGAWTGQISMKWTSPNATAEGTTDVRFELGLAAPGEGAIHTNVYQITKATMQWSDTNAGCPTYSDTTDLLPANTSLTVTESNGSMVYSFDNLVHKLVMIPICGPNNQRHAIPPQSRPAARCHRQPVREQSVPDSGVIQGTAEQTFGGVTISWTWTLKSERRVAHRSPANPAMASIHEPR